MSRFLFVVPPLTGHVNPAVGIAGELIGRGHDVAIAAHESVVGPMLPPGVPLIALPEVLSAGDRAAIEERGRALRGPASLKFLWNDFLIPLGDAMVDAVEAAVVDFRPDVLVVDQQAVGGALVGRRRGMPWATLATTSAELDDPYEVLAGVGQWVSDRLRAFEAAHGVQPGVSDLRFSDHLTLVTTVASLLKARDHPDHYAFIGAAAGRRRPAPDFPWDALDPAREAVLVSLGTVTRDAGGKFLNAAAAAVGVLADRAQAVVVAPPGLVADPPANVLVCDYVPQMELLERVRAVVSHAGNNTVCESLSRGVPLVVAPVRDDQPIIAEQVVRAGAGRRVRFGRSTPAVLATAIGDLLDSPGPDGGYRGAAERLRADFTSAGGVGMAANRLEKLT
jgi:MGT family glycosyltransferase